MIDNYHSLQSIDIILEAMLPADLKSQIRDKGYNQKRYRPPPQEFSLTDPLVNYSYYQYNEEVQLPSVVPPLWQADPNQIKSFTPPLALPLNPSLPLPLNPDVPPPCEPNKIHPPVIPSLCSFRRRSRYGKMNRRRPIARNNAKAILRASKNRRVKLRRKNLLILKVKQFKNKISKDTIYEFKIPQKIPELKWLSYEYAQLRKKLLLVGKFKGQFTDAEGRLVYSTGTAFAIGKNTIVTSAHLIYDFQKKRYCNKAFFYLNKKRYKSSAQNFIYNVEPTESMDELALKEELAIIFLEQEIEGDHFLQIASIEDAVDKPRLFLAAFPADNLEPSEYINVFYAKMQVREGQLFYKLQYKLKYHMENTYLGQSGGPLFSINKYGDWVVVGFHTHDRSKLEGCNQGIYFNKQVVELIKNKKERSHSEVFEEYFQNESEQASDTSQMDEFDYHYGDKSQNPSLWEMDILDIKQHKNSHNQSKKQSSAQNNPSLTINCSQALVILHNSEVNNNQ